MRIHSYLFVYLSHLIRLHFLLIGVFHVGNLVVDEAGHGVYGRGRVRGVQELQLLGRGGRGVRGDDAGGGGRAHQLRARRHGGHAAHGAAVQHRARHRHHAATLHLQDRHRRHWGHGGDHVTHGEADTGFR